ncbi:hypothetical protein CWC51_009710 [Enterococcus faecium]|nr:hypothetical protein [Enterococcus faecium]PQW01933.1 hypothetical protein CWC54_00550 [Enterococcus faecium]QKL18787.1 hypothetical protein CWC51_009710 [Enterococcus faecium]TEA57999.1 hypothetical protein CWC53_04445 [Enterococcus faecium]
MTISVVKIGQNFVVNLTTNLIRKIPKHLPNLAIFEPELLKRLNAFEKSKTYTIVLKSLCDRFLFK